jgi:tellurite resistance protein TerC
METIATPMMWTVFSIVVLIALIIDFAVIRGQGAHKVGVREAFTWSMVWIGLALLFNAGLWWYLDGHVGREIANQKSIEFFTGYLIEKSLAVDNIFVFLMLFNFFAVPAEYQKRVLSIGVLGAIVLRIVMILIGAWLIDQFHWLLYVFGAFLLVTGIKMLLVAGQTPDLNQNPVMKFLRGHMRLVNEFDGEKFFTLRDGVRYGTPLLLVFAMVGITDIVFAVDSIPAIFAITTDHFIVLTSNIFAILGLRAMYFLLADLADRFRYLSTGLAVVLLFIGAKMVLIDVVKIPIFWSLGAVALILAVAVIASWREPKTLPSN